MSATEVDEQIAVEEDLESTDTIEALPGQVELSIGLTVNVKRLKTREFFSLLRILTRGAYAVIPTLQGAPPGELVERILAALVFAIPEAPEETLLFVRTMVEVPDDCSIEEAKNLQLLLDNPEIDDLMSVLECVLLQERESFEALGKRLARSLEMAEKTGQIKKPSAAKKS